MTEVNNIIAKFIEQKNKYQHKPAAYKKKGDIWESFTWNDLWENIEATALGLLDIGVVKGETVCILSYNRPEWVYSDFGTLAMGGVTVPIYHTLLAKDVAYIINHCEAKNIFVENEEQLQKIIETKNELPNLKRIVLYEGQAQIEGIEIITFADFQQTGKQSKEKFKAELQSRIAKINHEDLATLVYTSGTTGPPKGAMITHGNIDFVCKALKKVWPTDDSDTHLSYLPLAHVYERVGALFFGVYNGGTAYYSRGFDYVGEDVMIAKPTLFPGVPRVFEKVYAKIKAAIAEEKPIKQKIFNWAIGVGKQVTKIRQQKKSLPFSLSLQYNLADKLVYNKLRQRLGGNVKYLITAAAPLSPQIIEFFSAAGFTILEGYGLTESTAPATINLPDDYKIGTVGKSLPGVEIKIAEDGEILIKGGNIFKGYYKNEEATKEAIDSGGYLHTGDVGVIDEDGFIKITDRKKDLIITAGGKNIAPQNIENLVKSDSRISQIVVIGDRQPYLVALITLNQEEIEKYAKAKSIKYNSYENLLTSTEIQNLVDNIISGKNTELASFESIKKFKILPVDFSIETGELTPTMKVKRKEVNKKYSELIEEMYKK